jgi:hypothetical protein
MPAQLRIKADNPDELNPEMFPAHDICALVVDSRCCSCGTGNGLRANRRARPKPDRKSWIEPRLRFAVISTSIEYWSETNGLPAGRIKPPSTTRNRKRSGLGPRPSGRRCETSAGCRR